MRLDLDWDRQQAPVVAHCSRCGGEIYQEFAIFPGRLCAECWEEEGYGEEDRADDPPPGAVFLRSRVEIKEEL